MVDRRDDAGGRGPGKTEQLLLSRPGRFQGARPLYRFVHMPAEKARGRRSVVLEH